MTSRIEQQKRRQAAWTVLEPHLPEEDLHNAIQLLNERYQESTMASLIRYINEVGELTGKLDLVTRKALYPKYFQLINDKNAILPDDPLPLLNDRKDQIPPKQPSSSLTELIASVQSLSKSATATTPDNKSIPEEIKLSGISSYKQPETAVFDYLIQRLLIRFTDDITPFLNALKSNADQDVTLSQQARDDLNNWINDTKHPWSTELDESALTSLVQLIYLTLCDAIGTAQSDRLFLQIFDDCDDIPESGQFPPTLFL